jgi:hypothetical protein
MPKIHVEGRERPSNPGAWLQMASMTSLTTSSTRSALRVSFST